MTSTVTAENRSLGYRLMATTIVAAVFTVLFTLVTPTDDAQAASYSSGFHKPDTVTYVGAKCRKVGPQVWDVIATFKVTGGRYANLGNGDGGWDNIRYNDLVRHGGKRFITAKKTFYGWSSRDHSKAMPTTFIFQQMVAPIGHQRDVGSWKIMSKTVGVNLRCG